MQTRANPSEKVAEPVWRFVISFHLWYLHIPNIFIQPQRPSTSHIHFPEWKNTDPNTSPHCHFSWKTQEIDSLENIWWCFYVFHKSQNDILLGFPRLLARHLETIAPTNVLPSTRGRPGLEKGYWAEMVEAWNHGIPTKPALNDTLSVKKIRKMYLFGMVELRYP